MVNLEKKVALITGSSRGIGRGCAIELAKCGADVIINYYRHGDEAEAVAEIVRGLGRSAIVIGADVSDVNAVEEMINEALDYYGQIDILVSNAAMSIRRPFLETTVEEVSKTLNVCMWGVFYVTHMLAKQMVKQGTGGKIVVISSIHALRPFPDAVAYNMERDAMHEWN
jgi:glucose 1-dehydrogenase